MITASNHQFRGKISSLLEELLASAVTEICELFDNEFATLRAGCPRCKQPKEAEKRTHLTPPHRNSPGNVQRLTTRDGDLRKGSSRGELEQNTNGDVGACHTIQCSQWSMGASNQQSRHASKEMMVSVKHEVVEESELQRGAQHGQEGINSSDISLPNSNLGLSTSLSPQTSLEWTPPEPFIYSNGNCDPKVELENGQSSSANKDKVSEKSMYDSIDYYQEQQEQQKLNTWNSDMGSGTHHGAHPNLIQHIECNRDGQEMQRVEVEPGNTHFTHWTVSPLKNQHSSRHRKPPEPVSVFNISLSGAVSLDVRAEGSANKLKTPLTRITSDQEKKFTCPLCGKRLRSEQTLKAHQKIHTGYAPHQCNQCGKRFSRLENLKVHQNIHTGLKPYTCKFCLKKFNAPSNFSRHKHICLKRKLAQFSL